MNRCTTCNFWSCTSGTYEHVGPRRGKCMHDDSPVVSCREDFGCILHETKPSAKVVNPDGTDVQPPPSQVEVTMFVPHGEVQQSVLAPPEPKSRPFTVSEEAPS